MLNHKGDGTTMLENTSMVIVRLDSPNFKAKKGPLILIIIWVVMMIVSFSAGAKGPSVMTSSGRGNAFNYSSGEWNVTYDPNGTTVTFHIEPHVYQQFVVLALSVAHPGSHLYESTSQLADPNQEYRYPQKWKIESFGSNKLKPHGESKFVEDGDHRQHLSKAVGLDMSTAPVHETEVQCDKNDDWCKPRRIWHVDHIDKDYYFFKLVIYRAPTDIIDKDYYNSHLVPFKIKVFSMNPKFTSFELGFKYFFLAITLLVLFCPRYGYALNVLKTHTRSLSSTHWWLLFLLFGLCWFNEPFIGARVLEKSLDNELTKFATFTATGFICFLLYYWLVLLDDCRLRASITSVLDPVSNPFDANKAETQVSFAVFYLPKMVLVFLIWCLMFVTYATAVTFDSADPSFQLYDNKSKESLMLRGLMDATLSFICIYILWILIVLGFVLKRISLIPNRYKWLAGLTLFTLVFTIVGLFIGVAYPMPNSSFVFLGFYGMINCYVWVMAIAWCPEPCVSSMLDRDAAFELAALAESALDDIETSPSSSSSNPFQDTSVNDDGFVEVHSD